LSVVTDLHHKREYQDDWANYHRNWRGDMSICKRHIDGGTLACGNNQQAGNGEQKADREREEHNKESNQQGTHQCDC